jgi:translocation and assembly module TamB
LQGRAELPKGERARLDLTLKGDNLPFVRRTGLLIRGDLDLKLTGAGNAASISGDVRLRESLFLTDVRALIPTGAKGSVHRPPYFSIEAEPLNSWRLNVGVNGERFLRLRTPVFNGTASARFRLSGTLGEPHIEGEATIDEGAVRLPFANFAVQQGQVRLSPEQLEPQIWITGTTRRYGYDVRMELSGSTSAQNLTFTSSPPLEAEQVLLMVMAGQAPQNEITTTDRQRAARFGAFFGQSLLGSIGGDASGADRLTISSGENISSQGRETYTIEYRLNPKWSLTGEYDEFDDYNGGFKWRFYERGGKNGNEKKK